MAKLYDLESGTFFKVKDTSYPLGIFMKLDDSMEPLNVVDMKGHLRSWCNVDVETLINPFAGATDKGEDS